MGRHGGIAVIERLILTLKQNIAWLLLIPLRRQAFFRELACLALWYNLDRPHMSLDGRTPDEVYHSCLPAIASHGSSRVLNGLAVPDAPNQ